MGPGSNIVPRSDTATTAIASGRLFAVRVVPSTRVDGEVHDRGRPVADALAVVEHRRLVLLAFADHDDAVHLDRVEHGPHGVDGGLVHQFLVARPT